MIGRISGMLVLLVVISSLVLSGCGEPTGSAGPAANAVVQTTPPAATTQTTPPPQTTQPPATTPPPASTPLSGNPENIELNKLLAAPAAYAGKTVQISGAVTSKGTDFVMLGALKCETNSDLTDILTGTMVYATGVCQVVGNSVTLKGSAVALIC